MKKIFFILVIFTSIITSCDNTIAKKYGGTMTVDVQKGYAVTNATWKENSDGDEQLWYFVEPMDENYTPKKKMFVEHSKFGVLEGKVIFNESK